MARSSSATTIKSEAGRLTSLRREDIFQQALALFDTRGFRGTSVQDIADACGVAKPAVYYYFRNKYDLLEQLYSAVTTHFYSQIGFIALSEADPLEKLRTSIEMQVRYSLDNRQFQRVFHQERKELSAAASEKISTCERQYEKLIRDIIIEGQTTGEFRSGDPQLVTMMILGLLASVHRWARYMKLDHDQIVDGVVDQLMNGIAIGKIAKPAKEAAPKRAERAKR